ncbi:serine carboxypeptidase [Epithele typhae]|uniref:serine carboxypeptidase n=1 Tax=Epithele typhae TaxID=378194 RepID=UPI002007BDCD|nr:serine carboxypeptidase [Epithele typhae]KAH9916737.1 serine carboxypeptidase [Epithele typhae]
MRFASSALLAVVSAGVALGAQHPFTAYDEGLFTPLGDLGLLSTSEFTTLAHPAFPNHNVRVKQSQFCDGGVNAYTGYIDVEARHLFFYFFESRRDPETDDVMFWTNGGPGASSTMGLFMELGPCRVTSSNSTKMNPYSWNEHANVFFVDQPVGVGYSYAEYGESVGTTKDAAADIAAFMVIFFEHFAKFKGRALHLAGESYGGRYIPVFASAIYDKNKELVEAGLTPVNLSSIMIGNGCTDFGTMFPSYYDAQCQDPTFPMIHDISTCVRMKEMVPRCQKRFKESCEDKMDAIDCAAASSFCSDAFNGPFGDKNHYDRARPCKGAASITECYPIVQHTVEFLSSEATQDLLGVDPAVRGNFTHSSRTVSQAFRDNLDHWAFPAQHYISALLERGVRTLIYVGATDYICNWIGNERMTLALEWSGQEEFRSKPLSVWGWDVGEVSGLTRSGGGLTYATIAGAGHMAPYDKPRESLVMANRWLAAESL